MVNYVIRTHQEHPIPADAVRRLYAANEWCPERSLQDITDVLNRNPAVGAWKEEDLIGFARAVLDGHFRAYIEDVTVHPDHRRTGIAKAVLRRLLEELADIDIALYFVTPNFPALIKLALRQFRVTSQVVSYAQWEKLRR